MPPDAHRVNLSWRRRFTTPRSGSLRPDEDAYIMLRGWFQTHCRTDVSTFRPVFVAVSLTWLYCLWPVGGAGLVLTTVGKGQLMPM